MTFTGGEHAGWAVQITTGFSIANTIANVLSGWASDFLWTKVSSQPSCIPFVPFYYHTTPHTHAPHTHAPHSPHTPLHSL